MAHKHIQSNRYLNEINQTLLQIEEELGLSQTVKFPTRDKSTLELFLTNRPSLLNRCEPIHGISDHDTSVYIDSDISIKRQRPTQGKFMLWNKTDLDGLKKEVTSFSDTFLTAHTNITNINSLWNDFKSGCLDIMNRYIPKKLTSTRYSRPWINREIKQLTRRKTRNTKTIKTHSNGRNIKISKRLSSANADRYMTTTLTPCSVEMKPLQTTKNSSTS